jgi:alpha-L-rhamnosidase
LFRPAFAAVRHCGIALAVACSFILSPEVDYSIRAETPGYKSIRIQPVICKELTWARTSYDSIRGRVSTAWNAEGGRLRLNLTIPANTTALLYLPANEAAAVTESGKPAAQAEGVKFLRKENGAAVYAVESGPYSFAE